MTGAEHRINTHLTKAMFENMFIVSDFMSSSYFSIQAE